MASPQVRMAGIRERTSVHALVAHVHMVHDILDHRADSLGSLSLCLAYLPSITDGSLFPADFAALVWPSARETRVLPAAAAPTRAAPRVMSYARIASNELKLMRFLRGKRE